MHFLTNYKKKEDIVFFCKKTTIFSITQSITKLKVTNNIILYLLLFYSTELFSIEIKNTRYGSNGDVSRLVFDLTDDVTFKSQTELKKIKILFDNKVFLKHKLNKNKDIESLLFDTIKNVITINFKKKIYEPNIYFLKKKNNSYSRIVIDYLKKKKKRKTIVIDPGHGGKDSGAVGIRKRLEKNITLKVGILLKKKFESLTDYKVILTRKKDIYLKLRERTDIAKKFNADIFISLHADSNRNKRTRGISLYTLSEKASDKEAGALAKRENSSDFLGNVDLSSESSEVTNILIDLTKRETLNQSSHLVNFLIKEFKNDMNLLRRAHRFAGFTVLKSLDIPSVLIEMGYLSNLEDSRLLIDKSYQNKITDDIVKAIKNYFKWKNKYDN